MIAAEGPQKGSGGLEGLGSPLGKAWDAWDGFPRVGKLSPPLSIFLFRSLSLYIYIFIIIIIIIIDARK